MITKIITRISVFSIIGLAFNFLLIYKFLSLWISPQVDDVEMIFNLSLLLIFELFFIPTGILVIISGRSVSNWIYSAICFALFAFIFFLLVKGYLILIIFGALIFNRILQRVANRDKTDKKQELNFAISNFLLYFLLVIVVACVSYFIPRFGLTADFLRASNYLEVAEWWDFEMIQNPHITMCFGVLYYLILTVLDIIFTLKIKISKNAVKKIEQFVKILLILILIGIGIAFFISYNKYKYLY